jgi:SHS2 domain-containing protein
MTEGYQTFDHTGDLGLEVWAATPERLFALAAIAVLAQVVETADVSAEVRVDLALEADDVADLLVHWLNTALLEAELRRAVWTRVQVTRFSPFAVSGRLEGPRLDPARQTLLREVKAVSHHGLELALHPPRCRCRIVLDL